MTEATAVPSLIDSLKAYLDDLPADERPDALHQVFYGFYTRVALIDRATHELAESARRDAAELEDLPEALAEALRDNALFVGQELFASRVRAMAAMGYVARQLGLLLGGKPPERPFKLTRAVAFDAAEGRMRTYDLATPGEHPDLPYDVPGYAPDAAT